MSYALIISLLIYICFDFVDRKKIHDEREELIRMKALGLSHYATMTTLCGLSLAISLDQFISPTIMIILMIFASLYTEMIGKIYFRRTL